MQFDIDKSSETTQSVRRAERIIRSCVHCGFCNAHCPTYRLTGDELDGPRGRIYLIKNLLEGKEAGAVTRLHLDRCLTCLSCESHCPSGVNYGKLLDIGRERIERQEARGVGDKFYRYLIKATFPHRNRFTLLLKMGRLFRALLPGELRRMVPVKQPPLELSAAARLSTEARRVLLFSGCVQPLLAPQTNQAAEHVLRALNVRALSCPDERCCGAIDYHLADRKRAMALMKRNIDAWWPGITRGADAIVTTASGCGAMIKAYGDILKDVPDYGDKARRISEITKDLSEVIAPGSIASLTEKLKHSGDTFVFQNPCTLQHGQKIKNTAPRLLKELGYRLRDAGDEDQCCGSAGTYSLLQPALSQSLLRKKIAALEAARPDSILTANIGCQLQLQRVAAVRVRHWIEIVAEDLR